MSTESTESPSDPILDDIREHRLNKLKEWMTDTDSVLATIGKPPSERLVFCGTMMMELGCAAIAGGCSKELTPLMFARHMGEMFIRYRQAVEREFEKFIREKAGLK